MCLRVRLKGRTYTRIITITRRVVGRALAGALKMVHLLVHHHRDATGCRPRKEGTKTSLLRTRVVSRWFSSLRSLPPPVTKPESGHTKMTKAARESRNGNRRHDLRSNP